MRNFVKACSVVTFIFIGILFSSCNNKPQKTADQVDKLIESNNEDKPLPKDLKDEDIIFYNIFTPSDMSNLIDEYSSYYRSTLINSLNNITRYNQSKSDVKSGNLWCRFELFVGI
jgi:hypothetical protein